MQNRMIYIVMRHIYYYGTLKGSAPKPKNGVETNE